jgi:RHH-type proline utilization regulon transcriptional repressor/proline dehydrogenase/delta 1-pyrroline-5-carboxylate dehydrogenase
MYAPVGSFTDLLPYLVRRMLENGANTSFVHQIADPDVPLEQLVADPLAQLPDPYVPDPRIPLPRYLYPDRLNSLGLDLSRRDVLDSLQQRIAADGALPPLPPTQLDASIARAARAFESWSHTPADTRAGHLEAAAELLEGRIAELVSLIVREGGRTYGDAVAEVREAADFCRYYALQARQHFAAPALLPGPAGERNELHLHGRGVFACISPWNFPLAIFTGQIAAALAAGNAVLAKPAEQTPLVGARAVELLHQAGIPPEVLHLLPGDGAIGRAIVADPRIAGVAFTGSTDTARGINQVLAARTGPIVPLIAETGGQNAMIVDSSALPEQVVRDVLISSFQSAGQRCSALRVLFVQEDIAEKLEEMLVGAMAELRVGDPALLSTDVGPVIDDAAKETLEAHAERMAHEGELLHCVPPGPHTDHGSFVAPRAFRIDRLERLEREVFGPILHVIRFAGDRLDQVLESINASGYGLTLGIHSRIDSTVRHIHERLRVGNAYVNRNMIGAVVGVQPFGGEGLSGTGPKAGGPRYLHRFATERTLTIDTTAAGGNASLLSLEEGA